MPSTYRLALITCLMSTAGSQADDALAYNIALTPIWLGETNLDNVGQAGVNSLLFNASADQELNPAGASASASDWPSTAGISNHHPVLATRSLGRRSGRAASVSTSIT